MSSPQASLDPSRVERLDRLALLARQRRHGAGAGPRRSPAAGSSVEFADYRTYAHGDDFRRVDWNVFARVNRLFLRIFEAEENSTLTLFLDCSASMAGGTPAKNGLARQIACALAYVALVNYDRVAVAGIGERIGPYMPPRSGRAHAPEIWRFITELPESGSTDLGRLQAFRGYQPAAGIAVVLSDMLTDSDWRGGFRALQGACRQDVTVIQVLSPDELKPGLDGDWTLVDSETGAETEVSISPATLAQYQHALMAYTADISGWCARHQMPFNQVARNASLENVVLRDMVKVGTLGGRS